MSTLELKGLAIEKIAALNNDAALKEIIEHLEKLSTEISTDRNDKVKEIFDKAVLQYGDALKKLAQ